MNKVGAYIAVPDAFSSLAEAVEVFGFGEPLQVCKVEGFASSGEPLVADKVPKGQAFLVTLESVEEVTHPVGQETYEVEGEEGLEDEEYTVYEQVELTHLEEWMVFYES